MPDSAPSLLIAYHTQSGASLALARAAADGAGGEGATVPCRRALDLGAAELAAADGLLLVCAENSGRLAGGAKELLDRIYYPLQQRGCVRPYALLISAGNDGRGAVAEAQRIFKGIPFTEALEPRIVRGVPDAAALAEATELGAAFAVGLSMGIF
jgi:hypothetical protein